MNELLTVKLKNGAEEAEPLVRVITLALMNLMNEQPIAAYELVECCRDRTHHPFGTSDVPLKRLRLMLPDGSIHDSVRNVVLASVAGEGFNIWLQNPIAGAL